jgi:hypothetical protein
MKFFTLLAILFIGLKLTNYVDWSWWLVLLPLYFGIATMILASALAVALLMITRAVKKIFGK